MSTSSSPQPSVTNTPNIQLAFRAGEKGAVISSHEKKVVIGNKDLTIEIGIYYLCTLKEMYKKNGYLVVSATRMTGTSASLCFKAGREGKPVSTFNDKIVIPADILKIKVGKEYKCEVVLSPQGKAYIVQTAEELPAATAEVVTHEFPVSMVEVKINDTVQDDLTFDCMAGDEKILSSKIWELKNRDILNAEEVIKKYESACREILGKYNSRVQDGNASRIKKS